MAVASGIICLWPSTVASIPSGWSRVAALDALYPKGAPAATNPGGTGGALTHPHSTSSHDHSADHVHTVPNSPAGSGSTSRDAGTVRPPVAHTHNSNPNTTNPTSSLLTGDTPSTDDVNHEPPFFVVIHIQSNGTPAGIPNNGIGLWNDSGGAPANWNLADGASGRPDLRGKFVKGAATSGDGGGSGGATTHSHTIASHTHGGNFSHDHPDVTSSQTAASMIGGPVSGGQAGTATQTHTHPLTIGTQATDAITGSTDAVGTSNNEPPYIVQAFLQNNTGGASLPVGIICLWTGLLGDVPTGWAVCDGTGGTPDLRDQFVKGASTLGGIGSTGGSLTHGHTATGHTHAVASHAHTVSAGSGAGSNETAGSAVCATTAHTHPSWSDTGAQSFTSGSRVPTVTNYTDTQPTYYTVAYVQKTAESNTYEETGSNVSTINISGVEIVEFTETGSSISPAADSGADVATFVDATANASTINQVGADVAVLVDTVNSISGISTSSPSVLELIETVTNAGAVVLAGPEVETLEELGTNASPTLLSGQDLTTFVDTGNSTSAVVFSGVEDYIPLGGVTYTEAGSFVSTISQAAAEVVESSESGSSVSSFVGSGLSVVELTEIGFNVSTAINSGADEYIPSSPVFEEAGAFISGVTTSSVDNLNFVDTGSNELGAVSTGSDVCVFDDTGSNELLVQLFGSDVLVKYSQTTEISVDRIIVMELDDRVYIVPRGDSRICEVLPESRVYIVEVHNG